MTDQTLNFEPLPKMGMWFKTHDCEDGIFFFCLSLEREDDGDWHIERIDDMQLFFSSQLIVRLDWGGGRGSRVE